MGKYYRLLYFIELFEKVSLRDERKTINFIIFEIPYVYLCTIVGAYYIQYRLVTIIMKNYKWFVYLFNEYILNSTYIYV